MPALKGIILRMKKNNESLPDPDNADAPTAGFIFDADNDPVGPDGEKMPRILNDIPCRWCHQHTRCIQNETCLGPVATPPARVSPPTTVNKGMIAGGKGDPSAPHHEVGKPYLPGGGGIHRLRQKIAGALYNVSRVESAMGAVVHYTGEAETTLVSALADSNHPAATEAIAVTREALQHAEQADSLIDEGGINLRAYRDSLYH